MSIVKCEHCNSNVDIDFHAEHFPCTVKMQYYRGSAVLKPAGRKPESAVSIIQELASKYEVQRNTENQPR